MGSLHQDAAWDCYPGVSILGWIVENLVWSHCGASCFLYFTFKIWVCLAWNWRKKSKSQRKQLGQFQFINVAGLPELPHVFRHPLQNNGTPPIFHQNNYFSVAYVSDLRIFMPPPFEEWWRGIKCYPCPCVSSCVRSSVRPLSKYGVRSITFERLHRFNSNLVCWYIISKHRSSSIWVTIY